MPLTINVGLSRKASKDYQSTGVSVNVTAELDQSLLARPDELRGEIDKLYAQAEDAIERQDIENEEGRNQSRHKERNFDHRIDNGRSKAAAAQGGRLRDRLLRPA